MKEKKREREREKGGRLTYIEFNRSVQLDPYHVGRARENVGDDGEFFIVEREKGDRLTLLSLTIESNLINILSEN